MKWRKWRIDRRADIKDARVSFVRRCSSPKNVTAVRVRLWACDIWAGTKLGKSVVFVWTTMPTCIHLTDKKSDVEGPEGWKTYNEAWKAEREKEKKSERCLRRSSAMIRTQKRTAAVRRVARRSTSGSHLCACACLFCDKLRLCVRAYTCAHLHADTIVFKK